MGSRVLVQLQLWLLMRYDYRLLTIAGGFLPGEGLGSGFGPGDGYG